MIIVSDNVPLLPIKIPECCRVSNNVPLLSFSKILK